MAVKHTNMVNIRFDERWKDALLSGRKGTTLRARAHGRRGQSFSAFGKTFALTYVTPIPSSSLTRDIAMRDGFRDLDELIDYLTNIYGKLPETLWLHEFVLADAPGINPRWYCRHCGTDISPPGDARVPKAFAETLCAKCYFEHYEHTDKEYMYLGSGPISFYCPYCLHKHTGARVPYVYCTCGAVLEISTAEDKVTIRAMTLRKRSPPQLRYGPVCPYCGVAMERRYQLRTTNDAHPWNYRIFRCAKCGHSIVKVASF